MLRTKRQLIESKYSSLAGTEAPAAFYADFSNWLYSITLRRQKVCAILAICINLPLFVAFDLRGFKVGYVESQEGFLYLVYWRWAFMSLSAAFLAASMWRGERASAVNGKSFKWTCRAYLLALGLVGATQSGYAHVVVHDVSVYALLLCTIACVLHTPDRFRWFVYVASFLTFAILAYFRVPSEIYYSMLTNAVPITAGAFALETIVYRQLEDVFISARMTEVEKEKSEALLRNVLPEAIATRLRSDPEMIADGFPEATILFADLVGFTEMASKVEPGALVELLNATFGRFDDLASRHGMEKIKTIGDAYMVACGLPVENSNHLAATADFALDLLSELQKINQEQGVRLQLRVGFHSGYVVGGIIGHNRFSYDVWGDNVNLASRMESTGIPGRIQVTESVALRLADRFVFEQRGSIEVKGRGVQRTAFLVGRVAHEPAFPAKTA